MSIAAAITRTLAAPSLCTTGAWLATQSEEDRDAFRQWLNDQRPAEQLRQLCIAHGLNAGQTSFREHARGVCTCNRATKPTPRVELLKDAA